MKTYLKNLLAPFLIALTLVTTMMAPIAEAKACQSGFLTFPAWYSNVSDDCNSVKITQLNDIWVIALNLIDILLQLVAYAATGFLVWAGFRYMKSRGDPSAISGAKNAIIDAIIGLSVSLAAVAIVKFVSGALSGGTTSFGLPNIDASAGTLVTIMNTLVYPVAGAVAVIFVIIGGYQFMTSYGDPASIKRARETLIYSVVGLVVVLMAFAITQFILGRFGS